MIANARMYSVSPEAAGLWRRLLTAVIEHAGLDIRLLEHAEPAPIKELWDRPDKAAVFMCGLPFSLSDPRPELIACRYIGARWWCEKTATFKSSRTLSAAGLR
jgi:hypothetical protein